MARMHGKDVRVYLGVRDVSGDLNSVDITASADTHDVTTFGAEYIAYDPGLGSWEASIEGFYQTNSGGSVTSIERQFETMLGSDTAGASVLSVYDDDADAVDPGIRHVRAPRAGRRRRGRRTPGAAPRCAGRRAPRRAPTPPR